MTAGPLADRLARARYPKLLVLVLAGVVVGAVGLLLVLTDGSARPGSFGIGLALLGAVVLLFGATGYVAFAIFERGFR